MKIEMLKRTSLILFIFLLWSCAANTPKPMTNDAKLHYDAGVGYLNKGETQKSIDSLKNALKISPNNPDINHALGLAYFQLGAFDSAQTSLEKAYALNPNDPDLLNNLASLYLVQGDLQDVVKFSTLALQNKDYRTPSAAFFNRGMAKMRMNQLNEASEDFLAAIQMEPLYDLPYVKLGRIYIEQSQFDKAIKTLDAALRVNPQNAEAFLYRGIAKYRHGYITEAENDFSTVLRIVDESNNFAQLARDWLNRIR